MDGIGLFWESSSWDIFCTLHKGVHTPGKCGDFFCLYGILGKQEKEEIQKAMVGLFKTSSVNMVKHTYHMDFETYLNLLHIADKWARCCQNEGQKGGNK